MLRAFPVSAADPVSTPVAVSITANALTIDLSTGARVFTVTNNANISSFSITNAPPAQATSFTIFMTANGSTFTQNWGTTRWSFGVAPTITTTNNKADLIAFATPNGTDWFANAVQNF